MLGRMRDPVDRIREQWAAERPDLDTEAMGILGRLNRCSAAARAAMDATCARHGISRADYDVLATLRRSGAPFQLAPGDLSRSLMLTSGGLTGRLDRLERAGLIHRSPDPTDRRSQIVALTEHGRELIDAALEDGVRTQQALLADLTPEQRDQLDELLRHLLASVTRVAEEPPDARRPRAAT